MDKIQKVSFAFRWLFQILFFLTPVFTALYWWALPTSALILHYFPLPELPDMITSTERAWGFVINLLPTAVVMFGLYQLSRLFKAYGKKEIFTTRTVSYFKKFGYSLCAWVVVGWINQALLSYMLHYYAYQVHHEADIVQIIIQSTDAVALLISGIIILIAWVMDEACTIAEEQAYTI